jgi:misacylated tRNA(Ala) deacylase
MTEAIFREDAYLQTLDATVIGVTDTGGIVTDRTIYYATGGGQPGDTGAFELSDGTLIPITTAVYEDQSKTGIVHMPAPDAARLTVGQTVRMQLDWEGRYGRMRMHTALHLLSVVLPFAVTGGSIGDADGRLDFDIPDPNLDINAIQTDLQALVAGDHAVSYEWITDAELDANPGLVKTMRVQPPRGSGRVRLVRIATGDTTIDLQPCGGTHVRRTAEIGPIFVTKIEKKGKLNRRVRIAFAPPVA